MNKQAQGRYRFQVVVYHRKRLDAQLDAGKQGIVLFVNWLWMDDKAQRKYLWGPTILACLN